MTYDHRISDTQTTAEQIEVERAIAEIRSGRPVVLRDDAMYAIVAGVEALDAALATELEIVAQGSARLILPAPRLRRLGLDRREPGFVALPTIDLERLRALTREIHSRIDAPVAGLSPFYFGALELLRLSLVLPAALAIPWDSAETLPQGLLSVSLANVQGYRRACAAGMRIVSRAPVPLEGAPDTEFVVFRGGEGLRDQVAVVVGAPSLSTPVSVRLHSACLTGDLFGSLKCDCGDQLRRTTRFMAENDGGILLYLDQEGRGNGISNKIRAYELQAQGYDTFDADEVLGFDHDQRKFDFAAKMLKLLGVTRVRVMTNNPIKIAALESAGLEVVSDHRIFGRKTDHNIRYLAAKRDRAGHLFECDS